MSEHELLPDMLQTEQARKDAFGKWIRTPQAQLETRRGAYHLPVPKVDANMKAALVRPTAHAENHMAGS